jgi:hypothetical protein
MSDVVPFEEFLARTRAARPEQYGVAPAEFEKMREYILRYYQGVQPVRSFRNEAGQLIDCIPIEQQPSARAATESGHKVVRTPPSPSRLADSTGQAAPARREEGGLCSPGSVPLLRLTLERLTPFGELQHFFRKHPPEKELGEGPGG